MRSFTHPQSILSTESGIHRAFRQEAAWIAASAVIFALAFGYKVIPHLSEIALANDWDTHLEIRWAPFYTILHFHQLPLWDPYRCGGMPLLGHPQSAMLTPFLLLDLLLTPIVSTHLAIVIHIAIAFSGACVLARAVGLSRLAATAAAGCFAGSSWYYIHMAAGHADFMAYTYASWAVAMFYLGVKHRRMTYAALSGLAIALMYLDGGVYEAPQTSLILGVLAVALAVQSRSLYPLMILALAGAWAAGFGAVKILPTLDFFSMGGRLIDPAERNRLWMFFPELLSRNQYPGRILAGQPWGFHEYGAYIGIIFGSLALLGIVRDFKRAIPWLMIGVVTLSLAAGYFGHYSPWVLIHKIPLFYSQRIPPRFLIFFTLTAGVLAGLGVDAFTHMAGSWGASIAVVVVGIALIDCWLVSASYLSIAVAGGQSPKPWFATFTQSSEPRAAHGMFMVANSNSGVIACNDAIPRKFNVHGFEDPGYRGEQYLLGPGSIALTRWTPNALSFAVDAPESTVMVINQNYDKNWRIVSGRGEMMPYSGLIAVRVPPGHQSVAIAFRSRAFIVGLTVSLLAIIAAFAVRRTERS